MTAKSIKFGDPRILAETTVAKDSFICGKNINKGDVVRLSAYSNISGEKVTLTLPSMAELMYYQANYDLQKASRIKNNAIKTVNLNSSTYLVNEENFYIYIQLVCMGILGLYSALETMVFELYIRKYKSNPVIIDGKELSHVEFTNKGFETKLTKIASQLSGKNNIYNTELMSYANDIKNLRVIIQHWDIERRDDYFINLPDTHPIKKFVNIDPIDLSEKTRKVLDHYKL